MSNPDYLGGLYPFLSGSRQDPARIDAVLLRAIEDKARESREVNQRFVADQGPVLVAAARAIADVFNAGGRLYTMGNGGSSCDAAHIAVEFLHPVTAGRPALAAINLVADVATLSALGNDLGFEHVFLRQIEAQCRKGDGLIGVSTSGNSTNLISAFAKAREIGMATIGLSGGDGGRMRNVVDHCLVVPTLSIHRVQENHVVAYHILWDLVHTLLADQRGSAAG
jgi:D-sedoheptulose 7-phosphate isomerase